MIAKRIGVVLVVLLAAAATATACGGKDKPSASAPRTTTTGGPSASGSASASPGVSTSPTEVVEFSVDGAGPYQLEAKLAALQAAGALDEVATGGAACPQNTTARGTGTWHDVYLSFHPDGSLYLLVNKSASVPTPSGAWLGTSLAELKSIYKNVAGQQLSRGTAIGYLVTTLSGRGILFELDPSQRVVSMMAGDATFLRSGFTGGGNLC